MRATRNSGVGLAATSSLAIDQIFCFAPSIKPPIEPGVSNTKQTSMRGALAFSGGATGQAVSRCNSVAGGAGISLATASKPYRPSTQVKAGRRYDFFISWSGDFVDGMVQDELDILPQGQPR